MILRQDHFTLPASGPDNRIPSGPAPRLHASTACGRLLQQDGTLPAVSLHPTAAGHVEQVTDLMSKGGRQGGLIFKRPAASANRQSLPPWNFGDARISYKVEVCEPGPGNNNEHCKSWDCKTFPEHGRIPAPASVIRSITQACDPVADSCGTLACSVSGLRRCDPLQSQRHPPSGKCRQEQLPLHGHALCMTLRAFTGKEPPHAPAPLRVVALTGRCSAVVERALCTLPNHGTCGRTRRRTAV